MDAAALASSIVNFIDLAYKIIRGSYIVYNSANGATEENDHARLIVSDLRKVAADLTNRYPQEASNQDLIKLSTKCYELSGELLQLLERFLPKGPQKWHIIVSACLILRKRREVASIELRLDRYRQQIAEHLLWLLFKQQSPMRKTLDEMLNSAHTFHNSSARRLENLESQLEQTLELLKKIDQRSTTETQAANGPLTPDTESIDDFEGLQIMSADSTGSVITKSLSDLVNQVQTLVSLVQNIPIQNRILRRLFYQSIFRREVDVLDAVGETFQWIFSASMAETSNVNYLTFSQEISQDSNEDPEDILRLKASESFNHFLRHDGRTFFVAGKAGCGKSTFMKYIAYHEETEASLEAWAGEKKLICIKIFFWQSDDARQGSIEGFYRSILFQVLSQCPDLIKDAFASQATDTTLDAAEYRISELEEAFQNLLLSPTSNRYCFCCFIDGLDEHQGDNIGYETLASRLTRWSSLYNVKIVCSARPYTVFLDAFCETGHVIHFNRLTCSDISNFAVSTFRSTLSRPKLLHAQKNCLGLVKTITDNAEGIFLWASIVVRDLINQALDDDGSEEALQMRLRECLERDSLDSLFQLMLQRVDKAPYIQTRSNIVLYLAANNPFESPLNALIYSWLDELKWFQKGTEGSCSLDRSKQAYSDSIIFSHVERVRSLLHQLTRGLLEIADTQDPALYFRYRVGLFHRSVREFLKEQWKAGARKSPFSTPEEEVQVYCRLRYLEARCVGLQQPTPSTELIIPSPESNESIESNLRSLFEHTFVWLRSPHRKGGTPPHQCLVGFENALLESQERLRPFLLGRMLINEECSWRYHSRNAMDTTSFLHWAAYWSQGEFVDRRLCDLGPDFEDASSYRNLSLLLSTSVGADVEATSHLLSQGFKPEQHVQVILADSKDLRPRELAPTQTWHDIRNTMGHQSDTFNGSATVWMIFLRDFASNVRMYCRKRQVSSTWPLYLDRDWLERLSKIVEAYLRAHADPCVYFILFTNKPRNTYRADLYQMLDTFKPENLATFDTLLKKPWWKDLFERRTLLSSPTTTYQSANRELLLGEDWKVLGVCSETGQELMGAFKVRVF